MAEHGRAAVARPRRTNSGWWCTGALLIGVNLAAGVLIRTVAQGRRPDDLQSDELAVIALGGLIFLGSTAWWWSENRRLQRRAHPSAVTYAEPARAPAAPARPGELQVKRAVEHPVERPVEPTVGQNRAMAPNAPLTTTWDAPAAAAVELYPPASRSRPPAHLRALRGLSATMERRMTDAGYLTQRELAGVKDEHIEDLAEELGTFPYRLVAWVAEARANTANDSPFMRSA
jgi:predicted flap endonuclease-1-like 5' DNA nuclease